MTGPSRRCLQKLAKTSLIQEPPPSKLRSVHMAQTKGLVCYILGSHAIFVVVAPYLPRLLCLMTPLLMGVHLATMNSYKAGGAIVAVIYFPDQSECLPEKCTKPNVLRQNYCEWILV